MPTRPPPSAPLSPKPQSGTPRSANRILAALPTEDLSRLRPLLATVALERRDAVWQPNQPIEAVYFPIDAVVSVLAVAHGGLVEVATIGREGMVGLPVFLGAGTSPGVSFCQVPGRAERLGAELFLREVSEDGPFRRLLNLYTQGFVVQVSQSTVCNRLHSARQRLARWLLSVADRLGREEFSLTHEFMAQMLGVRRATVTVTAGVLQRARLIRYSRGTVTIRDRGGLERVACECYRIVRGEFERLLSVPAG